MSGMRFIIVLTVLILAGCVSEPQPGGYGSDDFDQNDAAKTRISLGLTYLKNGNYSQAKVNLDKALEYAPRMADAHYSLAYYYQLVGENARAEQAFDDALSLAPRNADIANSYGAFLCQTGRYTDAKEYFLKAINNQQYASSAQTYENMAICAQGQGELNDAIGYLDSALKHQPGRAKSLFLLTELYAATEQWDLAKTTLRRYERVGRVSPDSLWLAVEIARGMRDFDTAEGYGEMLQSMYPENPLTTRYISTKTKTQPVVKITNKPQPTEVSKPHFEDVSNRQDQPSLAVVREKTIPASEALVEPTSPALDNVSSPQFHIVQKKENLYRISLKYNIKVSRLQEWNALDDVSAIREGMKLWLVPKKEQGE